MNLNYTSSQKNGYLRTRPFSVLWGFEAMNYTKLKGMVDLLPPESLLWKKLSHKIEDFFEKAGFLYIETPYLEKTELFARSTGKETEVVQKQMYSFLDKNEESITLRPEATASVVRAYVENKIYGQKSVEKYYYFGPMFRYEKPQKGRQRQFFQYGVEIIGTADAKADAEVISLVWHLYKKLNIQFNLKLNSIGCSQCKTVYREKLSGFLKNKMLSLCEDCQRRATKNPLRVFDCKNETCQKNIAGAPLVLDYICEACRGDFKKVQAYLKNENIDFEVDPKVVRGLDYYTKTAFEFISGALGAKDALCGGGRYDNLVESLGGPSTPAVGFSGGMERLILAVQSSGLPAGENESLASVFFVTLGDEAEKQGLKIANELRNKSVRCLIGYDQKSIKAQMRLANKEEAQFVCILGENELKLGKVSVKNMKTGDQEEVALQKLAEYFL